ncbi:MAG TPA: hypothetical protein VEW67_07305 [Thermoleophilaceae bacterium]|nr:hypothetical protein [Thermoleophilaceae bacterium]
MRSFTSSGFCEIGECRLCSSNGGSVSTRTDSSRSAHGGCATAISASGQRAAVNTTSRRPSGGGSPGIQSSSELRT